MPIEQNASMRAHARTAMFLILVGLGLVGVAQAREAYTLWG
jgi:hypothetical protein